MSNLIVCTRCQQHKVASTTCPHCNEVNPTLKLSLAILLGLGLMACGEREDDTSSEPAAEPAEEPASEPADAALYGVPSE